MFIGTQSIHYSKLTVVTTSLVPPARAGVVVVFQAKSD